MYRTRPLAISALLLLTGGIAVAAPPAGYDPLAVTSYVANERVSPGIALDLHDAARDRAIPIRVYLPHATDPAPVVLFSHGLGGSRDNNPYLGRHWSARGYAVVVVQHPGSDAAVWSDVNPARRMGAMKKAATSKNLVQRVADVSAVLDQLTAWNTEAGHPLANKLDLTRVGMSGHSFGALTTQYIAGMTAGRTQKNFADPRIDAAVLMSPSSPRRGDPDKAFGGVALPWLLMTGTHDTSEIGGADLASRRAVYPALPPGSKYELVLDGAEHSAFGDRALPGDQQPRNPHHHPRILALSTAFWDAYLRDDADARAWLDGEGGRSVLDEKDAWQLK